MKLSHIAPSIQFSMYHWSLDQDFNISKIINSTTAPRSLGQGLYGFRTKGDALLRKGNDISYLYKITLLGNFLDGAEEVPRDLIDLAVRNIPEYEESSKDLLTMEYNIEDFTDDDHYFSNGSDFLYIVIKAVSTDGVRKAFLSLGLDGVKNVSSHNVVESIVYDYGSILSVNRI